MNDGKLDCGCSREHACDFHRTHSAYQGTKDHGSLPIDYKLYKKLDEIIERLGNDVPYYPPEPTSFDFKFEGGSHSMRVTSVNLSSSAKDVPCLVDGPIHDWYEIGIYMKCSKCGMSYEKPQPSGIFYL